jgi:hypothetical protein
MPQGGWGRAASLALSLTLGVIISLSASLSHADVGGPPIATMSYRANYDPMGSIVGLASGLLIGALCGLACVVALRWAERRAERRPRLRVVVVAATLLALGALLLATPHWFHPVFGVDIH